MKRMLLITLLLFAGNLFAQNDPEGIIQKFFKLYEEKSSDAALDYLFGTNEWMKDSKDQIDNVKFKLNNSVIKSMGTFYGYYQLTKKTAGEKLLYYTYLLTYDRQPVRFNFLFYNPNGTWRLQNFSFDDSIDEELEESAKAYRLEENWRY